MVRSAEGGNSTSYISHQAPPPFLPSFVSSIFEFLCSISPNFQELSPASVPLATGFHLDTSSLGLTLPLNPQSTSVQFISSLLSKQKMTDTNQGGDSSKKTYHKKATGNALITVNKHAKEEDLKLYGSCFWYVAFFSLSLSFV